MMVIKASNIRNAILLAIMLAAGRSVTVTKRGVTLR